MYRWIWMGVKYVIVRSWEMESINQQIIKKYSIKYGYAMCQMHVLRINLSALMVSALMGSSAATILWTVTMVRMNSTVHVNWNKISTRFLFFHLFYFYFSSVFSVLFCFLISCSWRLFLLSFPFHFWPIFRHKIKNTVVQNLCLSQHLNIFRIVLWHIFVF